MIRHILPIAVLLGATLGATAADRPLHGVALVIGESKYQALPVLTNPTKDARDLDRLLGDLGFDVDRVLNADGQELQEAIARFEQEAKDADIALVYYSGHGIEAKGENFIAPTDTDISSPEAAGSSMIAVQPLLEALSKAAPVSIVLLDACRSDPFPPGQMIVLPGDSEATPVEGQGLAAVRGPTPVAVKANDPDSFGSVIGFSAAPGEPALDGAPGENSPYAAALLKHFAAGGYSFGDVMTMVTEEVYLRTKAQQLPWTNSSLRTVLTFSAPAEDDADPDRAAIKTERRKLLLSIAATPAETQKYVEALAGQEQVPLDALYGMLDALGIKHGTSDDGDLRSQLQQGADRLKQLMAEKPDAVKSDGELERLSKLADDAEAEGAIGLALKYRDQASARADTLLGGKQQQAADLKADMIDIADTYAANAATALLNFDQLHAADLYAKAFDAVQDWDKTKAIGFKISQGDALTDRGSYNLDNDALNRALAVYHEAQLLAPASSDPINWSKIESRIGQTQQTLGDRLGDRTALDAAVQSYESALALRPKQSDAIFWAVMQNDLGNAYASIGVHQSDEAALRRAIEAFDAALTVYSVDNNPLRWATILNNRGTAQDGLAHVVYGATEAIQVKALEAGNTDVDKLPEVVAARNQAIGILSDEVSSLDNAIAVISKAQSPLDWAMIAHTRAAALSDRGRYANSADDVQAAIAAYRAVLTVHDKAKTPVQWTHSAFNLAMTLRQYAELTKDTGPLAEAADLLRQGLALTPRAVSPLDWADLETKLGNVLVDIAAADNTTASTDAAVAAYRAAEQVTTARGDPAGWQRLRLYEVQALLHFAIPTMDRPRLQLAYDLALEARDTLHANGSADASYFDQMLPVLDQFLDALPK